MDPCVFYHLSIIKTFQLVVHLRVGHQDGLGLVRQELGREQVLEGGDRILVQKILLLRHC